jgi:uncharacterized damage-inducible protein DinB
MVESIQDPRRTEPGMQLAEREMLEAWLEFHRTTLQLKCEGLGDEERKRRSIPTSLLTLHGLVRHMAEVEHWWFVRVLDEHLDDAPYFASKEAPDADLWPLDAAVFDDDLATFHAACERSRALAKARSLDDVGVHPRLGPCSLRWVYVHMIEEYARHNGHADFLRELADGAVGD